MILTDLSPKMKSRTIGTVKEGNELLWQVAHAELVLVHIISLLNVPFPLVNSPTLLYTQTPYPAGPMHNHSCYIASLKEKTILCICIYCRTIYTPQLD
jgi:hypothetical protein